ncbi:hypothetical protein A3F29_02170 [Candidatus Roizmanbacteria bacterium RIFCSPHIGHO2_12_FULL_33_9]|uniref:PLD phosphodiesterase domain-containing protein n=1 Tax=Candidatus Roizmanbacteria bacterium RIFCSPHIGHO2_12_FULL_33_9 TaxID=1802045 RepID=A0A1F7HIJ8_9BACT|nr:MAG: hypothetical protein A3F29_02170 [Candidatus Roizmanbacteria bacterium RIFCSPHIGHO2_12_FULL_33_9]
MGIVEGPPERSTEVFGDLLYSKRDSKHRAIKYLIAAIIPLPFAFRKEHRALPIIATSVFGAGALVNYLESQEKHDAAYSLKSQKPKPVKPKSETPKSPEQTTDGFVLQTSEEFMTDMISSIQQAKDRVWLEFMQFESGEIMSGLVDSLIAAKERGVDVRLHLDPYTLDHTRVGNRDVLRGAQIVRNQKEPQSGLDERTLLQRNRFMTRYDLDLLKKEGIVTFTERSGRLRLLKYFGGGNHRKFSVVDDVSWLGTINLTDGDVTGMENFMLRITNSQVVDVLKEIFANPQKENIAYQFLDFENSFELLIDSGKPNNSIIFEKSLEMIENAKEKIEFVTQYWPTGRLLKALKEKAKQGVEVEIVMEPMGDHRVWRYPFKIGRRSFLNSLERDPAGLKIYYADKPTHAKGLLVDGKAALFGSHNLYEPMVKAGVKEMSIYTEDPDLVTQMQERIFNHTK